MIPRLVVAPVGGVVSLVELKAHLRVDGDDENSLIEGLEKAAVAHLDGWRGILGRCILPQSWQVDYDAAGRHRLPLPDVVSVAPSSGTATLSHDARGSLVEISEPTTITFTAQLPPEALDAVKQVIKLLVGHWFANREAVVTGTIATTLPIAADALLAPLRWTRL